MRANHDALAALDAQLLVPHRNFQRDVALLPLRGSGGEGAINGQRADRNQVAVTVDNQRFHVAHEVRRVRRNRRTDVELRRDRGRDLHFVQVFERGIHGGEVLAHDGLAALAVGLLDGVLDGGDGFVARQHAADGEEAGLHDGVDAAAHAGRLRHLDGVNHVELQLLLDDLLLRRARQVVPHLVRAERAVEQEDRAGIGALQHVEPLHEAELMAADEIRPRDEVRRVDRLLAEAQVRNRDRARLLRVIDEVALHVQVGLFAHDLDGVLVRAHRAVGAEAVEHGAQRVRLLGGERRIVGQAGVRDVVVDADGEVVLRSWLLQLLEDPRHHRRREFLRRQSIAPADDLREGRHRRLAGA